MMFLSPALTAFLSGLNHDDFGRRGQRSLLQLSPPFCVNNTGVPPTQQYELDALGVDSIFSLFGTPYFDYDIDQWVLYSALIKLFANQTGAGWPAHNNSQEEFGANGEYTQEVIEMQNQLLEFWQLQDSAYLVVGVHSYEWQDEETRQFLCSTHFAATGNEFANETDIAQCSDAVNEWILTDLEGGYLNPALTLGAAALAVDESMNLEGFVGGLFYLGDGMLQAGADQGYESIVNDQIHAHEFSHTVQGLALDAEFPYPTILDTPAATRRIELEADAMAGYFLAHRDGKNLDVAELAKVASATHAIGDCNAEVDGHHGTPIQRECAVVWAANVGMQDEDLTRVEFRQLFLDNLDGILAVDEAICGAFVETSASLTSQAPSAATVVNPPSATSMAPAAAPVVGSSTTESPTVAKDSGAHSSSFSTMWMGIITTLAVAFVAGIAV